jgi:hypothetical protein
MEIGHKRIELPHRVVTLLDAPGHQDFIPQVCWFECLIGLGLVGLVVVLESF